VTRNPSHRADSGERNRSLDILRGIAILATIGAHQQIDNHSGFAGWMARNWHDYGTLGVPLFFALSGYLVAGLIFGELASRGAFDAKRFLIRRGFKIYPAYYAFLAYLIAMPTAKAWWAGQDAIAVAQDMYSKLWPSMLFLQNYVDGNPARHTWSLAVEEHFYLLLPCLVWWLYAIDRLRWLLPLGLLAPVVFTAVRVVSLQLGDPYISEMAATHLRLDGLGIGVGLRALQVYAPEHFLRLSRFWWLWIASGVALLFSRENILPTLACGSALILLGMVQMPSRFIQLTTGWAGLPLRLLSWIGIHSYSIYLWHVTVMGIVAGQLLTHLQLDRTTTLSWMLYRLLLCAGIVIGGWALARLIEWPALRLRDRFFPSKSTILVHVPQQRTSAA
jgi:peptidoglycan/LPS O-acetylase OafA/YrhL